MQHRVQQAFIIGVAVLLVAAGCSQDGARGKKQESSSSRERKESSSRTTPTPEVLEAVDCAKFGERYDSSIATLLRTSPVQCARLTVPVDPADPASTPLQIAVGRIPASGTKSERIGSLIINPGGPGGSGVEFLASSYAMFPEAIQERFDLVSFDPRGVGASTALECLTQSQRKEFIESELDDLSAEEQVAAAIREDKVLADACEQRSGELARNMGTDAVIADLEMLRKALGDEPINFYGISYGTRIAAAYGSEYPDQVRALVLDGSVHPDRDPAPQELGQIRGILRAFQQFEKRCSSQSECPIADDPLGKLQAVSDQLDAEGTIPSGDSDVPDLTKSDYETAMVTALYDPALWDAAAEAVAALTGPASPEQHLAVAMLQQFASQQTGQREDGTYGNDVEVRSIVNCADADGPMTEQETEELNQQVAAMLQESQLPRLFGVDESSIAPGCTSLPTGTSLTIKPTAAKKVTLIIGNTFDPVTPVEFARSMSEALGGPQVLEYEGGGHAAGLRIACVGEQFAKFLLDPSSPLDSATCPQDPKEFDLFFVLEQQFSTYGYGDSFGKCMADALRASTSPLEILSLDPEEMSGPIVEKVQNASISCAGEAVSDGG